MDFAPSPRAQEYIATADAFIRDRVLPELPGYLEDAVSLGETTARTRYMAELHAKHPLGRLARASEVATAIAFLASDEASFITGTSLLVDGGYTAQ